MERTEISKQEKQPQNRGDHNASSITRPGRGSGGRRRGRNTEQERGAERRDEVTFLGRLGDRKKDTTASSATLKKPVLLSGGSHRGKRRNGLHQPKKYGWRKKRRRTERIEKKGSN